MAAKCDQRGRWPLEYEYGGKTWADFGLRGQPNKWVTIRALCATYGPLYVPAEDATAARSYHVEEQQHVPPDEACCCLNQPWASRYRSPSVIVQ